MGSKFIRGLVKNNQVIFKNNQVIFILCNTFFKFASQYFYLVNVKVSQRSTKMSPRTPKASPGGAYIPGSGEDRIQSGEMDEKVNCVVNICFMFNYDLVPIANLIFFVMCV